MLKFIDSYCITFVLPRCTTQTFQDLFRLKCNRQFSMSMSMSVSIHVSMHISFDFENDVDLVL